MYYITNVRDTIYIETTRFSQHKLYSPLIINKTDLS